MILNNRADWRNGGYLKPSEAAGILEGIEEFRGNLPEDGLLVEEAVSMAISALEFKERYDKFWEEVKTAGKSGKETEIRHSGRVFRIREVAQ